MEETISDFVDAINELQALLKKSHEHNYALENQVADLERKLYECQRALGDIEYIARKLS